MKFGKALKREMVPEWTEAYIDYRGLKRILQEVLQHKNEEQPSTTSRARISLHRAFSGLNQQPKHVHRKSDIEDQVINVNMYQQDGSRRLYNTEFLGQSEDGGDIEAKFFKKLDEELNKVNTFYEDKVKEMVNEASLLNKQMDALVALRIKVEEPNVDVNSSRISSTGVAMSPLRTCEMENENGIEMGDTWLTDDCTNSQSGSECIELNIGKDAGSDVGEESASSPEAGEVGTTTGFPQEGGNTENSSENPLKILDHVKINNTMDSPLSTIKRVFKDSKEEDLCFKKEELKKVEERLWVVFIEFYQKLRLLKHYSYMNLAAFSKIMKKYDKITSRRAAESYMKIVDNSYLGSSDEVTHLLDKVEGTFIKHFSNADRRKGMKSLRPKVKKEKHNITFSSGFFSGCSIALLVAVILRIQARKLLGQDGGASYMVNIFPLYSLFAYIVLHMLMYAAVTYFWTRYRINYPFIFGFKQGTELGHREVFLLSNGLAVLALACFLANLHLDIHSRVSNYKTVNELIPLTLVTVVLAILLCPFDIIYRSSRFFFLRCLVRCIYAPLYKVRLPDFFLADNLTSQVQAIRCVELYICYYGLGEYSTRQNKCHSHSAYNVFYFVVAVVPFWLRFLQCLRRLLEDRDAIHGYNALKYFLTIVAVLVRTAFELKKGRTWMVLALVSSAVAIIMTTYWDIVQDWGLLQRNSKNPFLRDKLIISHKSIYFAAMVLDGLLRIAWLQLVLEFNLQGLHKVVVSMLIACLEIVRRGIWNFFRLENEHLNNIGKYRAFKSVPLPFNYYDPDTDKDD
ncbi:hypothetical protein K2173_016952 [Erythroxylum novogranatense]|uniref:Phosphate transporter PHO1 homolog 10-like n=1 Tax=Erythroxylum novogranatense TaxID=1862640 RepID=A0AAV8U5B2_9ROSI|nr:hypothetical protein K2173_016952 [Erythroxylum novogranatense]